MSAYSIVNLKEEVEDSLAERAPGIEGRFRARAPRLRAPWHLLSAVQPRRPLAFGA